MMIDRIVRVAIHFDDERTDIQCAGPAPDGRCPPRGQEPGVSCAGAVIVPLRGTVVDGEPLHVRRDGAAARCPLHPMVRHVAAPWD